MPTNHKINTSYINLTTIFVISITVSPARSIIKLKEEFNPSPQIIHYGYVEKFDAASWFDFSQAKSSDLILSYPDDVSIDIQPEFEERAKRQPWNFRNVEPLDIQTVSNKDKLLAKFYFWDKKTLTCKMYSMFPELKMNYELDFAGNYEECTNAATVYVHEEKKSFQVYIKAFMYIGLQGLKFPQGQENIYIGRSGWNFRNLAATQAEKIKGEDNSYTFIVYRPGLNYNDSNFYEIKIPIWISLIYSNGEIIDYNQALDIGETNNCPDKRLDDLYLAPRLDSEGKRYAWVNYSEYINTV